MRTSLLCTIAMVSFAFREAIRTNIIATSATVYKISFVFAVFERKKKEVRNIVHFRTIKKLGICTCICEYVRGITESNTSFLQCFQITVFYTWPCVGNRRIEGNSLAYRWTRGCGVR